MAVSNYRLAKDRCLAEKTYKKALSDHAASRETGGESAPKDGFELSIYNINGNSNQLSLLPADISVEKGTIGDVNEESIRKMLDSLNALKNEPLTAPAKISIPIYIINITNILSNGNNNQVRIVNKEPQDKLPVKSHKKLPCLHLWSAGGRGSFIAVEYYSALWQVIKKFIPRHRRGRYPNPGYCFQALPH